MKNLNQIELYLDGSYTKDEGIEYMLGSRCICGYLERKLVTTEFPTKLSRINIHCTTDQEKVGSEKLNSAPILEVTLAFDLSEFFACNKNERDDIYAQIITAGLESAQNFMPVPTDFCNNYINQFKLEGYKNEWIHLEKEWVKSKIKCIFKCEVKADAFYQTQEIFINENLIISELISKTKPRELLFFQHLGKATLKNGNEIHYTTKNKTLSVFNIDSKQLSCST